MKNPIVDLLKSFEFDSYADFFRSLAPSMKYQLTFLLFWNSAITTALQQITGLEAMAVISFAVIMLAELVSGLKASQVKKVPFTSMRFSRFLFKLFYYIALLFFTNQMYSHYNAVGKVVPKEIFDWIHTYLVLHIGGENIISILENIGVIEGKPKAFYLDKIKDKLSSFK